MRGEVLDRWCERGILALVLAILAFAPLALGAVRAIDFAVVEFLTVGVLLLWGARLWLSPRPKLLIPPVCWAVLAFAAYAIGRYLTCDVEYIGRQEMIRVLLYAFLFFAILNNLHRQESVSIISFSLIFVGMAISAYALYQFLTGSDYVWHFVKVYKHRASGTFFSPNHLGGFLELLLPVALAYTISGRVKPVTRVLIGYAAAMIIAGILVTLSRGAWISTAVALLALAVALMFERRYRLPTLLVLAVIVVAGFYVMPRSFHLQSRLRNLTLEDGRVDSDLRFTLWEPAIRMWQDHPWWGVGPAHYNLVFRAYRPQEVQLQPDRAHNDYVNTLADWGVAGTALVVAAWGLLLVGIIKTWRSVRGSKFELGPNKGSNKFAFVVGGSVGLVAILCHSVFDFNMHIPANALVVVTLFALLSAHLRFATERYWAGAGYWVKVPMTLMLLGGAAYLAQQGWRGASEFRWLQRAAAAPEFSSARIALLKKAYAVEPMNAETTYGLGEAFRVQSSEGASDYAELAGTAMEWYNRGMKLDRWDGYNHLRYGMCLDWIDRKVESKPYFDRANELDPSNYFIAANTGLHFVELGDYAAAKPWFERSFRLQWRDNPIATSYLEISKIKLMEAGTNDLRIRLQASP